MSDKQHLRCYLGLGANLGQRARQLAAALAALDETPQVHLADVSEVYETAPQGYLEAPDYLNLVAVIETSLEPLELLRLTQAIEQRLGRKRSFPNAPRTIDIDLLLCNDIMMQTNELMLPHPRMWERQFVLIPLADVAPDLQFPGRQSVSQLARRDDPGVHRAGTLEELVRGEASCSGG